MRIRSLSLLFIILIGKRGALCWTKQSASLERFNNYKNITCTRINIENFNDNGSYYMKQY